MYCVISDVRPVPGGPGRICEIRGISPQEPREVPEERGEETTERTQALQECAAQEARW